MKRTLSMIAGLLLCAGAGAQSMDRQVISNTGGIMNTGTIEVSSTVGQFNASFSTGNEFTFCSGFQQSYLLNEISVSEIDRTNGITAWPNPTNSIVNIQSDLGWANSSVELYNSVGQKINIANSFVQTNNIRQLDLSNLATGYYSIRVVNGKELSVLRILVLQ